MDYFSPSKLNLFFRVLQRRSDGYHDIASLFQAIDLGDTLTLTPHPTDLFTCSDPTLLIDNNLVLRALRLFRAHYSFPSVHLHLDKRVPVQSGCGGGSGNAATTLWALNDWAQRPASLPTLLSLAATLGSDVAFFLSHGTAYCTGRGELLTPFSLPPLKGHLAKPPFGLSTPAVFQATHAPSLPQRDPLASLASFHTPAPHFYNDLEPAALALEPRLLSYKQSLLAAGYSTVCMTGSGSAFFCLGTPHTPLGIPFRSLQRSDNAWYVRAPLSHSR